MKHQLRRVHNLLAFAGVLVGLTAPATAQDPVLTLEGSCPGILRVEVSGAPPQKSLQVLFASELGPLRIPIWYYCGGMVLELGRSNLRVVAHGRADETGFVAFEAESGPRACGSYLQAITYPDAGCYTSNVVQIE